VKTIILSDNQPCNITPLGLYDAIDIDIEVPGVFQYTILTATGSVLTAEWDLRSPSIRNDPPRPPNIPIAEIEQGSQDWFILKTWEIHQAAIAHEQTRLDGYETYLKAIEQLVMERCVKPEDRQRFATIADYEKLFTAALIPQITEEALEAELTRFFQGSVWRTFYPQGLVRGWEAQLNEVVGEVGVSERD